MSKKIVYNRSKTYLLPLLSEIVEFDMKFMKFLENTYMFDEKNEYGECLCILHEFSFKNPEFTHYEHKLTNNELFIKSIDLGKKVLYIFRFPQDYMGEYYSFYNGKYSEFGDDAKQLILKFWAEVHSNNPAAINFLIKVKQILYREEKLRQIIEKELNVKIDKNAELGEKPNVEQETFKINIHEEQSI